MSTKLVKFMVASYATLIPLSAITALVNAAYGNWGMFIAMILCLILNLYCGDIWLQRYWKNKK